jgi:aminopeptidase N
LVITFFLSVNFGLLRLVAAFQLVKQKRERKRLPRRPRCERLRHFSVVQNNKLLFAQSFVNLYVKNAKTLQEVTMRKSNTINDVRKKIVLLFVSLIFCAIAVQAQVATQRQAKTVQKPLPQARYIPARTVDIQHIKLDLHFNLERETVKGIATITFSPLRSNLEQAEFDAANMSFASVKFENGTTLKFEDDDAKEKIRIKLDKAYQPSQILTLIIEYQTDGTTNSFYKKRITGNNGLIFVKPDRPNGSHQIWSQGESEWNHFWFPCYDHPNDFSTSEMIATVEKPYMVISNGKLIEEKDNNDNTRTFHWKMEQPHASYLVSIVVGEFEVIEDRSTSGVPVISYVPKNKVKEARQTVARVPKMIDFFESYTGIKFPYTKYGQAFARKFNGGMENITATTLEEEAIIDEQTAMDKTSDDLLAHELAHSWFGNYVTARSWSELWLNESFATYFEQLWTENHLGHDEALYSDLRANQENYFKAWKEGNKRPIVTRNYKDPDAVFDVYAYPRGSAVLNMLRKILGEDDWKRAINYYLKKHAHQPVSTEEFRIAIEESTGQPLEWFFDEWVYKMGHPVFDVTQTYDAVNKKLELKVRQIQKQDQSFSYPQVTYFQMPVEVEITVSNGTLLETVFIEPVAEQEFVFSVNEKPLFVNFDYESTLIKELNFPKPLDELIVQLQRDRDVLGRLFALKEMQKRLPRATRVEKEKVVNAIVASLSGDKFWGIRRDSAVSLRGLDANEKVRTALIGATKDTNAAVRVAAVVSLSSVKGVSLSEVYLQLLNDKSYDVVDAAANALGSSKSNSAYVALIELAESNLTNSRILSSALQGLSKLNDARTIPFLEKIKERVSDSESKIELEHFIESMKKEKSKP